MSRNGRLDGLAFVGVAFFAFMILNVLKDQGLLIFGLDQSDTVVAADSLQAYLGSSTGIESKTDLSITLTQSGAIDSNAIAPPYEHYMITQGPHGAEYGHQAIDISDGKGALILSPINGWVANLYIDEWGNPSLVLENDRYLVELLHGVYSVKIGDKVVIGQPIGQESNQGNTADPWGYSCIGRDCGYHTHINVYDKTVGANLNPLDLFPTQQ